ESIITSKKHAWDAKHRLQEFGLEAKVIERNSSNAFLCISYNRFEEDESFDAIKRVRELMQKENKSFKFTVAPM
ncbi:hypothetical protein, partial [Vibrio sp. 10N.222.49.C9]